MVDHDHFILKHLRSVQGAEAWYYNLRFLGRGGNGTAFLVTCSSGKLFGMQLVLKVFHRISDVTRRRAFLQEIAHLKTLRHPAITDIYDEGEFFVEDRGYPFAIVEYVPLTVRQLLVTKQLDRLRAIRISGNCLSALQHIHGASPPVIHRDLKPENILLSAASAKLADFGLAKAMAADSGGITDPLDGTQWPGMPYRYRTPELVERARDRKTEVSPASDIYQFGTVFYELLTGYNPQVPPRDALQPIELDLREIRGAQGDYLSKLIRDMLAENPTRRPTAGACLHRLNRIHREMCRNIAEVTGQLP